MLRADLGKVLNENILNTWKKRETILQEALDSSGLAGDSSTFEAFFLKCLIRQIKRTLSGLNICDHIHMCFCPGLVEISASRTDPAGAIHSTGSTHTRTFCEDDTLLSLFYFSLIFPLCHPLQLRILRFLAPRGSGLCLLAAPPLHPPGQID